MSNIDSSLLAQIFFSISLVVFLIALYIILPAFIYRKRTILKPRLINAMWVKFYEGSIGKLKSNWQGLKKKELMNNTNMTYSPVRIEVSKKD